MPPPSEAIWKLYVYFFVFFLVRCASFERCWYCQITMHTLSKAISKHFRANWSNERLYDCTCASTCISLPLCRSAVFVFSFTNIHVNIHKRHRLHGQAKAVVLCWLSSFQSEHAFFLLLLEVKRTPIVDEKKSHWTRWPTFIRLAAVAMARRPYDMNCVIAMKIINARAHHKPSFNSKIYYSFET